MTDWTELDDEKHRLADRLKVISFTDPSQVVSLISQIVRLHTTETVMGRMESGEKALDAKDVQIQGYANQVDTFREDLKISLTLNVQRKQRIDELEMRLAEVDRG